MRPCNLALDLGTSTGWALQHIGTNTIVYGTQSFKPQRFEGGGMRYLRFRQWLEEVYTKQHIAQVAYEEVRGHKGVDAAQIYGGLLGQLTSWCEERTIPYQGVPVGTIKRFWTGKGNAPKEVMIRIAQERGFQPEDDNAADALAILHWMMTYAPALPLVQRPPLHGQSKRRVPVEPVAVAPRRVRVRID